MNLPNKLTVGRIGLTMLMVFCLTMPDLPLGKTLGLLIFILAVVTDVADGIIARSRQSMSAFGKLMDPLADKVLVCAAFVCFVAIDHLVPAWIVVIIISREFLITGLRLLAASNGQVLAAGDWGKQKMIWQTVFIIMTLVVLSLQYDLLPHMLSPERRAGVSLWYEKYFLPGARIISMVVATLTLVSGFVYLWRHRDLFKNEL